MENKRNKMSIEDAEKFTQMKKQISYLLKANENLLSALAAMEEYKKLEKYQEEIEKQEEGE